MSFLAVCQLNSSSLPVECFARCPFAVPVALREIRDGDLKISEVFLLLFFKAEVGSLNSSVHSLPPHKQCTTPALTSKSCPWKLLTQMSNKMSFSNTALKEISS